MTQNKGIETEPLGGRWEGDKRTKRPKFATTKALDRHPFTLSGLPIDIVALLGVIVLFGVGFIVTTSFMAAGLGQGWLLAVTALLVAVGFPAALAFWAVRPMSGRRAFHWWLVVFAAPFLLATVGLSLGVPLRTARMLRWYGPWPAQFSFGPKSSQAHDLETITDTLSIVLSGFKSKPRRAAATDAVSNEIQTKPITEVTYMGRAWFRPSHSSLPEDLGQDHRHELRLIKKRGAWLLQARFGPLGRPATLLLDPKATRTILSLEAAARLGIKIPAQAPSVVTGLPGHDDKHPVVVIPWISVGHARVSQIAVALCSSCVHEGLSGRLGANFLTHFHASLDSHNSRLRLIPEPHHDDRPADIDPFVTLALDSLRRNEDRVTIAVTASAARPIANLHIEAILRDTKDAAVATLSKTIDRLEPGAPRQVVLSGVLPESVVSFKLRIWGGHWAPKRVRRRHHKTRRPAKRSHR